MKIFILSVPFAEVWVASLVRDHLEGCVKLLLCCLTAHTAVESPLPLEVGRIQGQKEEETAKPVPCSASGLCGDK